MGLPEDAQEKLLLRAAGGLSFVNTSRKRGRPDDWQDVLDDWKSSINALATEFVEGRCDVSPRDDNACRYCGLEAVCRIDEMDFSSR